MGMREECREQEKEGGPGEGQLKGREGYRSATSPTPMIPRPAALPRNNVRRSVSIACPSLCLPRFLPSSLLPVLLLSASPTNSMLCHPLLAPYPTPPAPPSLHPPTHTYQYLKLTNHELSGLYTLSDYHFGTGTSHAPHHLQPKQYHCHRRTGGATQHSWSWSLRVRGDLLESPQSAPPDCRSRPMWRSWGCHLDCSPHAGLPHSVPRSLPPPQGGRLLAFVCDPPQ